MKILEIFTFAGGYKGGVATMVLNYIQHKNVFKENNCIIDHLNIQPTFVNKSSKISNVLYIFTQRREVKRFLKNNRYDKIHIHTSREFLFLKDLLLARMINRKFNLPVILTIHVGDINTVYNRIEWFKSLSIKFLNEYVEKVIFLSNTILHDYIARGLDQSHCTVLYNFHTFNNIITVNKANNVLRLLYVGAIHKEKGICELLKALCSLKMNFHLNVCGLQTDPRIVNIVTDLKNKLGDKVTFCGYIDGIEKEKIFKNSDILILPSYHEGLPLVIMEALGAGCAIISTKVGGIPEILSDNNVRWVEVASVSSLVNVLSTISLSDINTMKCENLNLGKSFTIDSHILKLCEIYKSR